MPSLGVDASAFGQFEVIPPAAKRLKLSPSSAHFSPSTTTATAASAIATPTPAKSRRVRTGCLTCRQRHLKCDEGVPDCANCRKSGRRCKRGIRLNFIDTQVRRPPRVPAPIEWSGKYFLASFISYSPLWVFLCEEDENKEEKKSLTIFENSSVPRRVPPNRGRVPRWPEPLRAV